MILHNKYYEVLREFLGDYTKNMYGREFLKTTTLSQKGIALALLELEKEGILTSKQKGTLKLFGINKRNPRTKDILLLIEVEKKRVFLEKYKKIAEIFKEDQRIVGIFGSYAKGNPKNSSDVDIFIIGKKEKEDYKKKGDILDLNISIKYFTEKEWNILLKKQNSLAKEIIENHVLIFGLEKFIIILWREYYGFNRLV